MDGCVAGTERKVDGEPKARELTVHEGRVGLVLGTRLALLVRVGRSRGGPTENEVTRPVR